MNWVKKPEECQGITRVCMTCKKFPTFTIDSLTHRYTIRTTHWNNPPNKYSSMHENKKTKPRRWRRNPTSFTQIFIRCRAANFILLLSYPYHTSSSSPLRIYWTDRGIFKIIAKEKTWNICREIPSVRRTSKGLLLRLHSTG